MKKIVSVVLNNFKNDSRVLKECLSLKSNGYDVKILALHDGDPSLKEHDYDNEIPVHRICLKSKAWSKSLIIQVIKYMEFLGKACVECKNANIIHCNDLNALPVGVICKIFSFGKIKIVYDAHEFETEREGVYGFRKILLKISEKMLIGFSDKVITVCDGIAEEYASLYRIEKPEVVLNAPKQAIVPKKNIFRVKLGISDNQKIFLYQGSLSEGNGINVVIDAFKKIKNRELVLVLMGYGPQKKDVEEAAAKYDNIFFHEAVPVNDLLHYTSSADYGIACIDGSGSLSYYYTLPNKLFEYSMSGIPTIISSLPEMVTYNKKYNFGIACEYTEDSFIKAMDTILASDYKVLQNGALTMARECCWEVQEKKLLKLYNDM